MPQVVWMHGDFTSALYIKRKSKAQNSQKWLNHIIWHKEGKAGLYMLESSLHNGLGSWTSGSLWCHIYLWCNRATSPAARKISEYRSILKYIIRRRKGIGKAQNALRTRITMIKCMHGDKNISCTQLSNLENHLSLSYCRVQID